MNKEIAVQFNEWLSERKIKLNDVQLNQFAIYYRELVEWNEKMNLTAITEREQVYVKHFYDSLSLSFFIDLDHVKTMADIGSGAGFPGIPLLILYPHLQLTIIDSLKKRIGFLQHLSEQLGVKLQTIHGRAEDLGRDSVHRDQYDLVTARAVARLNVLNEFCLPFVKPAGRFAAMKGSSAQEELEEANFSMKELRARLIDIHRLELPGDQAERHIIVLEKTANTPAKYPRSPGIPLKKPLG
ncbi:16S rRNA (guanine(527)-N(7))-methyltransferase RsmG [Paenibacillus senegalensis]|uniref:16S rRNA (guanine(527)-N(7))-methyltransferase RsmG n=1 Tax=Paenibacillus senegalensis TaxID=1465766 RepID=UPI0002893C68|nr:16S rRNA (guanine(527)-N(7))-methyltransferase RsmG [Paenibacillus senegalensis]